VQYHLAFFVAFLFNAATLAACLSCSIKLWHAVRGAMQSSKGGFAGEEESLLGRGGNGDGERVRKQRPDSGDAVMYPDGNSSSSGDERGWNATEEGNKRRVKRKGRVPGRAGSASPSRSKSRRGKNESRSKKTKDNRKSSPDARLRRSRRDKDDVRRRDKRGDSGGAVVRGESRSRGDKQQRRRSRAHGGSSSNSIGRRGRNNSRGRTGGGMGGGDDVDDDDL
jgi:hypothetical protein